MSGLEKKIGKRIAELRIENNLTQAQLAEAMGLSVESISRMERGVTFPSVKTLARVAEALGSSLKQFFDFDEDEGQGDGYQLELAKLIAQIKNLDEGEVALLRKILREIEKWKDGR
ncbi:transcriptional regulator, XRE family [Desulfatibacillum aliphaticivorans]|uniref:Transcriptional regulator, XRE family n=1 Tax=Desulfatibacillum aliphaticivorans TaxID=218208 RepID=B8FIS5_DESAL|nr:helix-turn-helix transcriptional regulator [Desulfatibacillum aliphaticivorans]ACL04316.1 transcriptional regulator, XRE family [Desulfatibacillum aliphaticivorans]